MLAQKFGLPLPAESSSATTPTAMPAPEKPC
jgi:hypothetical protein